MRTQQRSNIKMSATNSNFDGPEFFQKNLKDLQNNANQSKYSRSSVVMQATETAEPTVSGDKKYDHIMEGFQDMMFFHKQYVTLADIPHQTANPYIDELMMTAK